MSRRGDHHGHGHGNGHMPAMSAAAASTSLSLPNTPLFAPVPVRTARASAQFALRTTIPVPVSASAAARPPRPTSRVRTRTSITSTASHHSAVSNSWTDESVVTAASYRSHSAGLPLASVPASVDDHRHGHHEHLPGHHEHLLGASAASAAMPSSSASTASTGTHTSTHSTHTSTLASTLASTHTSTHTSTYSTRTSPRSAGRQSATRPPPPPPAPGTPYLSGPREAALADALARGDKPGDPAAALDEYAWRSLKAGVRVRDYCSSAARTVRTCASRQVRLSLIQGPVGLLYPFGLAFGALVPVSCPQTLPLGTLSNLSKKVLADALVALVDEPTAPLARSQVIELALEYVGRRWREGDHAFVDAVAKKFAEVQAELQAVVGAGQVVIPALDAFRFQFGFVETGELISLINRGSTSPNLGPERLLTAWTTRRLSVGTEPALLAADLHYLRDSLCLQAHRNAVNIVLSAFALDGRLAPHSPSLNVSRTRTRTLSRLSFPRGSKRKTLALPWLNKLQYDDRRPSLPTHLAPAEPSPSGWSRIGTFGTPIPDFAPTTCPPTSAVSTRKPVLGMSLADTSAINLESSNSLGLSDPSTDVRAALADHLLFLRYRLGPDADGWSLGGGKDKAVDFLDSLECKEETRDIVHELRQVFDLLPRHARRMPPASAFQERDVSFDLDQYIADIGPQGDEAHPHALVLVEADSDEEELEAVAEPCPPTVTERELKCRSSVTSIATAATAETTQSSAVSISVNDYTICEATRVPMTATGVEFRFPASPNASKPITPTSDTSGANTSRSATPVRLAETDSDATPGRKHSSDGSHVAHPSSLLPPFEDQPTVRSRSMEFPITSLTSSPSPPGLGARPSSVPFDSPSPPPRRLRPDPPPGTPLDQGLDSRGNRHQFRQYVIVDGQHLVPETVVERPPRERTPVPPPLAEEEDIPNRVPSSTALRTILSLFMDKNVTEAQAEEKLSTMIELEVRRADANGPASGAETKGRVMWLVEQVAAELSEPRLAAAAERVLDGFANDRARLQQRHLGHGLSTSASKPRKPSSSPRRRDLTIVVPPRDFQSVVLFDGVSGADGGQVTTAKAALAQGPGQNPRAAGPVSPVTPRMTTPSPAHAHQARTSGTSTRSPRDEESESDLQRTPLPPGQDRGAHQTHRPPHANQNANQAPSPRRGLRSAPPTLSKGPTSAQLWQVPRSHSQGAGSGPGSGYGVGLGYSAASAYAYVLTHGTSPAQPPGLSTSPSGSPVQPLNPRRTTSATVSPTRRYALRDPPVPPIATLSRSIKDNA